MVTIVVLLYLKSGTRSTSYLNGHVTGSITNTERKKEKKTTLPSQALFFFKTKAKLYFVNLVFYIYLDFGPPAAAGQRSTSLFDVFFYIFNDACT